MQGSKIVRRISISKSLCRILAEGVKCQSRAIDAADSIQVLKRRGVRLGAAC
jgi:hypothetical protein